MSLRRSTSRQRLVSWDAFDASSVNKTKDESLELRRKNRTTEFRHIKNQKHRSIFRISARSSGHWIEYEEYELCCTHVGWIDLPEDTKTHLVSFLSSKDVRSLSATSRSNLYMCRQLHVWLERIIRSWPLLEESLSNTKRGAVQLVDDRKVEGGSLTLNGMEESEPSNTLNLSFLEGKTHGSQPSMIDTTIGIGRIRRSSSMFRKFNMNVPVGDDPEAQRIVNRQVVQFTSSIGMGDRCLRATSSFPCISFPTNKSWWMNHSFLDFLCRGRAYDHFFHHPYSQNYNHVQQTRQNNNSHESFRINCPFSKSFVAPFISKQCCQIDGGQLTIINVTPRLVAYYEISIYQRDRLQEPIDDPTPVRTVGDNLMRNFLDNDHSSECIAIGLSTEKFPIRTKMPGWDDHSYGYHGDDGGMFHSQGEMLKPYGPRFGPGDTVGCGLNYLNKGIFFTLNGSFLGYAWFDVDTSQKFFPTVGIDSHCPIAFNFGTSAPFMFDLTTFCHQQQSGIHPSLDTQNHH